MEAGKRQKWKKQGKSQGTQIKNDDLTLHWSSPDNLFWYIYIKFFTPQKKKGSKSGKKKKKEKDLTADRWANT